MFYKLDDGIKNYTNTADIPEDSLKKGADHVRKAYEWCLKHHKTFLYVIAPDKSKIYGEYYGLRQARSDAHGRGQQFIDYIHQTTSAPAVYLRSALLPHKEEALLYWKNDTHWNLYGAYHGYRKMMEHLQLEPLEIKKWKHKPNSRGDLSNMYQNSRFQYEDIAYKAPVYTATYTSKNHLEYNRKDGIVEYNNPQPIHNLKVYVIRDSFSTSLGGYLAQTFSKVTMHRKNHFTADDLERIKSGYDIVIFEHIERKVPHSLHHPFPKED